MRTLLTHSFYFFGVIVIGYELLKMGGLNASTIIKDLTAKSEAEKESNKSLPSLDKKLSDQITFVVVGIAYFAWLFVYMAWNIVGLFSSQWKIFLILFIMTLVLGFLMTVFKKHQSVILKVDAFLTVVLLVFMVLNKFHLHIF